MSIKITEILLDDIRLFSYNVLCGNPPFDRRETNGRWSIDGCLTSRESGKEGDISTPHGNLIVGNLISGGG